MFGLHLTDLKQTLRNACDGQFRFWAGTAFVALALVSIQYEEVIAPGVGRISDVWSAMTAGASDFSRKLTGLTP